MNQSEAYTVAFNPSDPGNRKSVTVSACRVVKRPQVAARIEELKAFHAEPLVTSERDARLLDNEWLKHETLTVLYKLATQGESERIQLEAAGKLALACHLISQGSAGTTVNVQQNSANLLPGGSSPDQIRSQLVASLRGLLPLPVVVDPEVIDV